MSQNKVLSSEELINLFSRIKEGRLKYEHMKGQMTKKQRKGIRRDTNELIRKFNKSFSTNILSEI